MSPRYICAVARIIPFWVNNIPFYVYTTCCLSISWGTLVLFPFWVIMKNAVMNVCDKFSPGHLFSFLLDIYLGEESLSHRVTLKFICLRNCQTVFQNTRTIIHSHQWCGFQFLYIIANTCFCCFVFTTATLVGPRWYSNCWIEKSLYGYLL